MRQLRASETAAGNLGAEIERLIAADSVLSRRLAVLSSIPGVGAMTAIALFVFLSYIFSFSFLLSSFISFLSPIAFYSS